MKIVELEFRFFSLTPAPFALTAHYTVTESLLFLQSSKIKLVVNRNSEKFQVLFIGCQHLLSQSCESLDKRMTKQDTFQIVKQFPPFIYNN